MKKFFSDYWKDGLIIILIGCAVLQFRINSSVNNDINALSHQIVALKNQAHPKLAILNFDDTVRAWQTVDQTGDAIHQVLESTIKHYNDNGYTIVDTKAVIGGTGNAVFIKIAPNDLKDLNKGAS